MVLTESEMLGPAVQAVPARKSLLRELIETILLTLILFVVAHFSVQNYKVDGTSMLPTLQNGELILVDKVSYKFHLPSHGDIVVFKPPMSATQDFIKRVVGLPNDRVTIKPVNGTNHVFVNGRMLDEPYILAEPDQTTLGNCADPKGCSTVVPRGDLFVMGDNRNGSYDSRAWGFLDVHRVVGRAVVAYWPITHLSFLPSQYSYAARHT